MSLIKEGAGEPRAVFVSHGLRPDMVGIISRAPQTWIDRSLGQIQGRIPDMGTCAEFKESSEARWKSASGFEARDSRLAIVVPIHDEEKSLETFLEVLRTWNLPGLVRAEIMLITNGCADNSEDLVQEFLNRIGSPVTERLPRLDRDPELDPIALSVRRGDLKFIHIDTDKAGKANVLSVANDLAVKDGYDILINSDANTYPEPDAIASLYGYSRGLFEEVGNKTVVVSGAYSSSFRPGWEVTLGRALKLLPEIVGTPQVNKAKVGGGLFAWNVNWLNKMGGMPEAILDDEALSVLVRIKEKEIDAIDTAVHHGFHPNNLWDDFLALARYARGTMQIRDLGEDFRQIIDVDRPEFSIKFSDRLVNLGKRIREKKSRFVFRSGYFLVTEAALLKARWEYSRDSSNQSWDEIKSTK